MSNVPSEIEPGTFETADLRSKCPFAELSLSRGGGTRTHTPFQDPDFKSENPRSGASYHVLVCSVDMPKTRLFVERGNSLCPTPF